MNRTIHAVLWDNDGVLVDSETVFFEITRSSFARLGLTLTEEVWGTRYLGEGGRSRDVAASMGGDPAAIDPVMEERNREYLAALREPPAVRPRVRETLEALSGRVKMAIVTGCRREQLDLMHSSSGLLEYFDFILTADDYDESKPSPVPYLAAVRDMKLDAGDCIAVEDSKRGLESAIAAGVACVVVPTDLTRMQNFSGALAVEPDVSAVLKHAMCT